MVHPRLPIEDEFIKLNISGSNSNPRYINVSANVLVDQLPTFQELFSEYRDIFAYTYKEILGVDPARCQHRIPLREESRPVLSKPYRLNPYMADLVRKELDKLLECDFIYPGEETEWASPVLIVPKKETGKIRNAPATFQRYMMNSFLPLNDHLKLYLDDLCAHGPQRTHVVSLRATFNACRKARISLNPDKCFLGASYDPLLGLLVSHAGTSINPRKIECILQIPIPETVRDLRKFLGCKGYYRRFIFRYAVISAPLTALLQDLVDFFWSDHC
ncbi:hypothetical protein R1sor_000278 [Riccia sorocarpa]|uniref:Reverse transcriptase domain-containing protein n=1 Tax=Riccia sorocarpa TaxID=122646 RepID=A0ABD3GWU6_9MARC